MFAKIDIPYEQVAEFCQRWQITELALFGSVLRDDFTDESDVDVLVSFAPGAKISLFTFIGAQDELSEILGRKVDLVERSAIENSRRRWARKHILETARTIYDVR